MTERYIESLIADLRETQNDWPASLIALELEAASALESQAERITSLEAVIAKVKELHRPYDIYEPCDHGHDSDDTGVYEEGVVDVEGVGLTCAKIYDICAHCCVEFGYTPADYLDGGQTEECADGHKHGPGVPICKTAAIIAEAEEKP